MYLVVVVGGGGNLFSNLPAPIKNLMNCYVCMHTSPTNTTVDWYTNLMNCHVCMHTSPTNTTIDWYTNLMNCHITWCVHAYLTHEHYHWLVYHFKKLHTSYCYISTVCYYMYIVKYNLATWYCEGEWFYLFTDYLVA